MNTHDRNDDAALLFPAAGMVDQGQFEAVSSSAYHPQEYVSPALPQELIDQILEIIVRCQHQQPNSKGNGAVGRCMLVSRSFLTSIRRYLFESITIRDTRKAATFGALPPSETARMEGLLRIFRNDPLHDTAYPLVAHVRSVKMVMESADSISKTNTLLNKASKDSSSAILDWNSRRVSMREVLRAVKHLERFSLGFSSPISGYSMHVGISLAIEKACKSSLLTQLEFSNIFHFPVDLLAECMNLRHLILLNVSTGESEDDIGPATKRKSYAPTLLPAIWGRKSLQILEILDTENSGDVLEEIRSLSAPKPSRSMCFSQIKTFKLGLPTKAGLDNYREVEIMRHAASTLESLTIRGITGDISFNVCPGRLCLSDLKSLRSLHLDLTFSSISLFGQIPLCLDALLGEQLHSPTTIETIGFDVVVKVAHFNSKFSTLKLEMDPAWATIDHHLTNGAQFPVLRKVTFNLLIFHHQLLPSPFLPRPESWEEVNQLKTGLLAGFNGLTDKLFQAVAQSQRIKYDFNVDFTETWI
ncbi:hypothetical protein BDN70DRAFT_878387 [Pholiota conissans]|uniref:Uncharacterized protein n=1 Tax=Pholiota conissans TaxID=109636 RepID=A0A9P6CUM4_9AGAR|nr:hypothetical protein BDN70DRAFT_878387 [Pholiota conissans]